MIAALLMLWDIVAIHGAYFLALWFRFDCRFSAIPMFYLRRYAHTITPYALASVAVFWNFRLYHSVWKYASVDDLVRSMSASALTSGVYALLRVFAARGMPRSYHLFGAIIQLMLVVGIRFSFRMLLFIAERIKARDDERERVMVIGAGSAGQMLIRDMNRSRETHVSAVCLIDDDPTKQGRYIEGVPVVGGRDAILYAAKRYHVDKIFLTIPSASAADRRDILNICNETDCKLMQLPGMYQFVLGEVSVSQMKDVSVEDLLGREPIQADMREVFDFINGKVVLVTGGGGSIGSELCRQIAAHDPKQLILFDNYENNTYSIQLELREEYPALNLVTLIGSVQDSRRVFQLFRDYRPQIVYHAAAHKHVPLMEDSPCEAIKNNAMGTYWTAYAAMVHGCERFVLISTDKAVNPTNIMGASKRLCE
ncbi:MAG: polysaccharide biosynthesis protein, partial [bacterium]